MLPAAAPVTFDGAQHLVSLAVGEAACRRLAASQAGAASRQSRDQQSEEPRRAGLRSHLARLLDAISGPAPD